MKKPSVYGPKLKTRIGLVFIPILLGVAFLLASLSSPVSAAIPPPPRSNQEWYVFIPTIPSATGSPSLILCRFFTSISLFRSPWIFRTKPLCRFDLLFLVLFWLVELVLLEFVLEQLFWEGGVFFYLSCVLSFEAILMLHVNMPAFYFHFLPHFGLWSERSFLFFFFLSCLKFVFPSSY